jgi:uncharacterized membrane protein YtjA (UPF0391 family)
MSLNNWMIVFLLLALLTGLFSLIGKSRGAIWIARFLFGIFLVIAALLFTLIEMGIRIIA